MEGIKSFFDILLKAIGSTYPAWRSFYNILGVILAVVTIHKIFYFVIGFFFTRKFKPAKRKHRYGIVIAARNEEKVIGNLLDSINKQDYPKQLLKVFVVADNCTDNTAKIARSHGAICYERNDPDHRTKGYALQFLFKKIASHYGIDAFEGYFVLDADNLLKRDYISKMNNAFDAGCKIITSYRNTKNFSENWVASTYALHWLRSIRTNHRARSVLHLATNIQGTGFLFANEIVSDGWKYTSLTEDRALTADAVAKGYEITYQDEAEFYDEQPISLKVALRQRLRWSKGHLQAFVRSGPYLFINIFMGKRYLKTNCNRNEKNKHGNKWMDFVESIRHRFASFDTLVQLTPIPFINLCRWLIVMVFIYSCSIYLNGANELHVFADGPLLVKALRMVVDITVSFEPGIRAFWLSMVIAIWLRILYRIGLYVVNMLMALYLFIVEDARIPKISIWKKVLFIFTWPTFDIIGRYTTYIAIFKKVEWKPIPHNSKVTIDDISGTSDEKLYRANL